VKYYEPMTLRGLCLDPTNNKPVCARPTASARARSSAVVHRTVLASPPPPVLSPIVVVVILY
jgi:hypothetical protein